MDWINTTNYYNIKFSLFKIRLAAVFGWTIVELWIKLGCVMD